MVEYNFQYLMHMKNNQDSLECTKIMNAIDKSVSQYEVSKVFHIVPIMYSIVFLSGIMVYIYKILS